MRWLVQRDNRTFKVELPAQLPAKQYVTTVLDGETWEIAWDAALNCYFARRPGEVVERPLRLRSADAKRVAGESAIEVRVAYASQGDTRLTERTYAVQADVPGMLQRESARKAGGTNMRSPMTGKVLAVRVANGDTVTKGQELLIVEAMKMENRLTAPAAGVVEGLTVEAGAAITAGQALLRIS